MIIKRCLSLIATTPRGSTMSTSRKQTLLRDVKLREHLTFKTVSSCRADLVDQPLSSKETLMMRMSKAECSDSSNCAWEPVCSQMAPMAAAKIQKTSEP